MNSPANSIVDNVLERVISLKIESPTQKAWRRFRRNRLALMGMVIILLLILSAVFANFLTPYDPYKAGFSEVLKPPSIQHWLGTDHVGRDNLCRLLFAGRFSLLIGFTSMAITLVIGMSLGGWAGWRGGRSDYLIMRLLDVINAFPTLLMQIVLASILSTYIKKGAWTVILALSITGWTGACWLIRSQLLSLRQRDYIVAAQALGANDWDVIIHHLLPNAMGTIIVYISFGVPGFIAAEAGLSFLGLGITPPTPTWGQMLGEAGKYIQSQSTWYLVIPPAIILAAVLLCFQFIGDGMQAAFNPSSSKKV
jgi:ABC-type dipeptide/oligopeptide/nickel transport system permease subunit